MLELWLAFARVRVNIARVKLENTDSKCDRILPATYTREWPETRDQQCSA